MTISDVDVELFHTKEELRQHRQALHKATTLGFADPLPSVKRTKDPLEGASQGTRVLFDWANWLKRTGLSHAETLHVFTKDTMRLLVHEYRHPNGDTTCGCAKFDDSVPRNIVRFGELIQKGESRLREFREWKQPLTTVITKLQGNGWTLVGGNHA